MVEWLERRRKHHPEGGGGVFEEQVDFLARFTLKLSVKKPEWFINHILSFILSSQCPTVEQEPALRVILRTYAPFLDPKSLQNGYFEISATSIRTTEDLDSVTCQSSSLIRSNIELLIGLLVGTDACISVLFVDIWSEVWIEKEEIPPSVHWTNVLKDSPLGFVRPDYGRLIHHPGQDSKRDDVAIKFSEALNLLFHSECPVAGVLLHEVVGILAGLEKGNASAFTIFSNVVIYYSLKGVGPVGWRPAGSETLYKKSLVAYESAAPATSRSSSTTIVHILTRLKTLVSNQGETGELTRRVLSSERVVRLFAHLLNVGRKRFFWT
ncbi:hypothetical protein PsorP6_012659 [Peronosclerospora sorghi]|uniref:Uncharacterized protein n=1 Tax=Peronosclerospora sorghi TaxID=230839 RepID=A0ACC0WI08_9STRA|nr:hypothetical protein PsorP6_012659 [Peronosclerospora sorghi]